MVTPIFFDASYLIALHNEKDPQHSAAIRIAEFVLAHLHPYQRVLTDCIFDEAVTTVKDRGRNIRGAIAIARWLKDEWLLEIITVEEFEEAYDLFVHREDKVWSFTDCTSYVWMKGHGIRYAVSWDSDFDQFGFIENLARR